MTAVPKTVPMTLLWHMNAFFCLVVFFFFSIFILKTYRKTGNCELTPTDLHNMSVYFIKLNVFLYPRKAIGLCLIFHSGRSRKSIFRRDSIINCIYFSPGRKSQSIKTSKTYLFSTEKVTLEKTERQLAVYLQCFASILKAESTSCRLIFEEPISIYL